jgi:putative membrane protein
MRDFETEFSRPHSVFGSRNEVPMSEAATQSQPRPTPTELAVQRTDLAFDRTRLAEERTLMAWIRTSLSLISFGFTIYKFLQELAKGEKLTLQDNGPRNFGLALISLGTVALIVASIQHVRLMKVLRERYPSVPKVSLALVIAVAIAVLGGLAFIGILIRIGPF